jgi:hypothetical protein
LTVSAFEISYLIPIALRLCMPAGAFVPGPVHLGAASRPVGVASVVFLGFTALILYWPPAGPVTAANMNYTAAITAVAAAAAGVWWWWAARARYEAPGARFGAGVSGEYTSLVAPNTHTDDSHPAEPLKS